MRTDGRTDGRTDLKLKVTYRKFAKRNRKSIEGDADGANLPEQAFQTD
jgi:hypothetical protein